MSEKSRNEKLAAAKKKLKKFQDSNFKEKNSTKNDSNNCIKTNQIKDFPNNSNLLQSESDNSKINSMELLVPMNEINSNVSPLDLEEPTVTTESLKHISRHLNGIISCSSSSIDREAHLEYVNTIRDLEKRNIDLASLNSQKAEQIEAQLVKISSLQESLERFNKDSINEISNLESSYKRQIDTNKDQLQAQIHTISLLVAEKSELQSQVNHNQKLAVHRLQENEDITNKLKSSRQKVGDLEKILSEIKIKNDKLEEVYRDTSRQTEQMRNIIKKFKSEKDENTTECSELRSKLLFKNQEVANLELTLDDVKSQLEMSQVQIQHLTNSHEGHFDNIYSQLKITEQKNLELMQNLEVARLQIEQSDSQSIRFQNQYRNYFEQMEEKLKTLQSELSYTLEEKEDLSVKFNALKNRIPEKESDIQIDVSYLQNTISNLQQEKKIFTEKNQKFEFLVKNLNEANQSLSCDNEQLARVNKQLEERNIELSEKYITLNANKIDHVDLLQQLQSDKTALSRALTQNKQLKSQLIELQEAFVKLSSDNMDLSTKLDHEKHVTKELSSRLGEQEDDLNEIRQMVGEKDNEISRLKLYNKQITEELLTTNNSIEINQFQRSESHFNIANNELVINLQTDICHLQEKINDLTTENNTLQYRIEHSLDNTLIYKNNNTSNEYDGSVNIDILQLESERNELLSKCQNFHAKESELLKLLDNKEEATDENDIVITKEKYQSLQLLLHETNKKYQEIKDENSKIFRENKRLEHIVAQLEGETDTISEYISLYQHQRSILKQKSLARDQFMSKLVHQKQLLDSRLLTLENLIKTIIPSEHNDIKSHVSEKENINNNSTMSILNQIIDIIHELKKPSAFVFQALKKSSNADDDIKFKSNDSFVQSDNLFHSEFIHCKCCVGKVIDL